MVTQEQEAAIVRKCNEKIKEYARVAGDLATTDLEKIIGYGMSFYACDVSTPGGKMANTSCKIGFFVTPESTEESAVLEATEAFANGVSKMWKATDANADKLVENGLI